MPTLSYLERRGELETYFDRTAADAWKRLTSDVPVSGIRKTVRAGRDQMRNTLLSWLPDDLTGARILDAGCGTGALAYELAQRGADVVATDLSSTLVSLARDRSPVTPGRGRVEFRVGDFLLRDLGRFDHVVAMDSLIHYRAPDMVGALAQLASRTRTSVVFTFAPRTPLLATMHAVGRLFPRGDRAPAIEPISRTRLGQRIEADAKLVQWRVGREHRVTTGFYMSHALELVCA
jgi:magnesium-protoporphyrin O-methyltransferase